METRQRAAIPSDRKNVSRQARSLESSLLSARSQPVRFQNSAAKCWPGLLRGRLVTCQAASNREPVCQEPSEHPLRCAVASPRFTQQARGYRRCNQAHPPRLTVICRRQPEAVLPDQIRGAASRDHESCRPLSPDSGSSQRVLRAGQLYLYPPWSRDPRPRWSRPVRNDVRSMFARMSRYSPAERGIRSPPRI